MRKKTKTTTKAAAIIMITMQNYAAIKLKKSKNMFKRRQTKTTNTYFENGNN